MSGSQKNDDAQFGLANVPFGVVSTRTNPRPQIATRIAGQVYVLPDLISAGYMNFLTAEVKSSLGNVCYPRTWKYVRPNLIAKSEHIR